MVSLTDGEFKEITEYVRALYGIDLTRKRFLIESKLTVKLMKLKLNTFKEFKDYCDRDITGKAKAKFVDILTTNYTYFYREEAHYKYLEGVIRELHPVPRVYRVWSAGCSSGQEAYTTAMELEDLRTKGILKCDFKILGTDICTGSVEQAQAGKYTVADYVRLPESWQKFYCVQNRGIVDIKRSLKEHVSFQLRNLLEPWPPTEKFNLIFCRNVMIYFDADARDRLLRNISHALEPGGYLFIGHSEIIKPTPGLRYIRPAVYQKAGEADGS